MFWVFGTAGIVIAGAAWLMLLQSDATTASHDEHAARSVAVVETPPVTAEAPPDLSFLQDLSTPAPKAKPKQGKPPAQDPAARAALYLVGVDSTAELIWLEAINNPKLSKQERQDLIEDLNEDGMSNRKQPTHADLPLIQARLQIIDRLMPEAMDEANLDAFAEARKDLINMQVKLTR